ncbi:hypothetical protein MSAS_32870 [Mycobacterium saskatchewanense]|uniref:TMEM165/GDT1 family protein n=1 Tax=Mycobacterium saskatchewanense TaxID=220927 RepID=UPI00138C2F1D|nr:hypothetical protein MSAS_32870 [Mycobacterium saskatchewanense]
MLAPTLLSLGVVFLAELGNRSQLITMAYALRYRWCVMLLGVAVAAFGVHGVSDDRDTSWAPRWPRGQWHSRPPSRS